MEKKVLVTEEERRWIAKNAVVEMGSKVVQKVIDLDIAVERIKNEREKKNLSPYIEIQPVSEDMFKTPHKQPTYQKDPLTGVLYGIAISSDEFGNIRWQKIQLGDSLSLNMDNMNDARVWAVLRFNPDILNSPFQNSNPYYKVYDPVDDAMAEQREAKSMQEAFGRVGVLIKDPKQMVQFARFLGEDVRDNTNYEIVYGTLLRNAKLDPEGFNRKWQSRARSFAEHFYSAHALGIILEDANGGFTYGNIQLGLSRQEAIKAMAKDPNIMNSISAALDQKDKAVQSVKATMGRSDTGESKTEGNDFD
jgi:hypothetical protein